MRYRRGPRALAVSSFAGRPRFPLLRAATPAATAVIPNCSPLVLPHGRPRLADRSDQRPQPRLADLPGGHVNGKPRSPALVAFRPAPSFPAHRKEVHRDAQWPRARAINLRIGVIADRLGLHLARDARFLLGLAGGGLVVLQALDRPALGNDPAARAARRDQKDLMRAVLRAPDAERPDLLSIRFHSPAPVHRVTSDDPKIRIQPESAPMSVTPRYPSDIGDAAILRLPATVAASAVATRDPW